VFWPWLQNHRPGVRMFYCYPFGRTDLESLQNFDLSYAREHNYIFFLDQEPINLERQSQTFNEFVRQDLQNRGHTTDDKLPILVTSEYQSAAVEEVCKKFNFESRYYFFHGWAALDWYRGYNYSQLIVPTHLRQITKTFVCPNRIIGGDRRHRILLMYLLVKKGLQHNHISFPARCPFHNEPAEELADFYRNRYSDISDVMAFGTTLPFEFDQESGHPMTSYKLDLFKECNQSLIYVVTETVVFDDRQHLTEKTFKPIALGLPFILQAPPGSLKYLRSYGFQTFDKFIDESYDLETDLFLRTEMIAKELKRIEMLSPSKKQALFESMIPVIEHNRDHFYNGGFEKVLKQELYNMLESI
jgi:hypothetical protein